MDEGGAPGGLRGLREVAGLTPLGGFAQNLAALLRRTAREVASTLRDKLLTWFFDFGRQAPSASEDKRPSRLAVFYRLARLRLNAAARKARAYLREQARQASLALRNAALVFFLGPGWLPQEVYAEPLIHTVQLSRGVSGRSLAVSMSLHLIVLSTPLPAFFLSLAGRPAALATASVEEVKWLPTSRALPPIMPARRSRRRPSPGGKPGQPLPPLGAKSVRRQTIVSDPPKPNHPTQTLLQQFALEKARVEMLKPRLPNMVIPPGPAPTREIDLRRLRIPNAPIDLSRLPRAPLPPRPKTRAELALRENRLENLLPRLTLPTSRSSAGAGTSAAPDISLPLGPASSGDLVPHGLLALSANPNAPSPLLQLPDANLRARIVAGPYAGDGSPGGVPGGVPGAEGGSGGGPGGEAGGPGGGLTAPDIFVAPAGPVPQGPVIVGPGGQIGPPGPPSPQLPARRPAPGSNGQGAGRPQAAQRKTPEQRGRDLLAAIHPGAQSPEAGSPRRVYVAYLFISSLTSQSSSWLLQYTEFTRGQLAGGPGADAPLTAPQVVKKVDPCYSGDPHWERVEGTVVLYAVIRVDGAVEDVVVMRSVGPKVDARAVAAFRDSRFEPARKNGVPVAVEVLVEIPFRLAPCL